MIGEIKLQLEKNQDKIEDWFAGRFKKARDPIYSSVDIRNSHYQIAVVDTNAFPAGFNNLCPKYCEHLASTWRDYIVRCYPGASKILVFPEQHTRNKHYLENIRRIGQALEHAGFEVGIGTNDPELRTDSIALQAIEGEVSLHRITREGGVIEASGFRPDLVLSNNDFSGGVPEMLQNLDVPVTPPPGLGWHRRHKHEHFRLLNDLIAEFAPVAEIDPFLISTAVSGCVEIDFKSEDSRERLAREVDGLIATISGEYERRGIKDEPYVFIKHDAGTYGMAIMTARSGDEVRKASRKTRVKMRTGKGRVRVTNVMVQEGILTRDRMEGFPMEPVIYMVGQEPVGGFYRLHRERGITDNLNVSGMEFRRLCFHQVADEHPESLDDRCEDAAALLMVYGTLARLAALALGLEMKALEENG